MYAIAFDLDNSILEDTYRNTSFTNAYLDIKKKLEEFGFERQQGSVYFGDINKVNAVTCVSAVMTLTQEYDWFAGAVKDIRMLRIEDNNDLTPIIENTRLMMVRQDFKEADEIQSKKVRRV